MIEASSRVLHFPRMLITTDADGSVRASLHPTFREIGLHSLGGLSQLADERDVVGEDDHLPVKGELGQARGHVSTADMVERGDRVVEDDRRLGVVEVRLGEEPGETNAVCSPSLKTSGTSAL